MYTNPPNREINALTFWSGRIPPKYLPG